VLRTALKAGEPFFPNVGKTGEKVPTLGKRNLKNE
jgi:hypothetical protein